jgi:flagellar capping protein FliD
MEQRVKRLENNVERFSQAEKKHDFTIRDSSVKIGLAEGLAEATHRDINQLKLEVLQVKAELQATNEKLDSNFEDLEKRIDSLEDGMYKKFETIETLLKQILEKQK